MSDLGRGHPGAMRIVVTGATGNIGTALLRRLGEEGAHQLVGLARRPPDVGVQHVDGTPVGWTAVDLTDTDCVPTLHGTFAGADAVVHLAWGFQPSHDTDHLRALGVHGTRRVLDAAESAGVPHLVHMSSAGAYSPRRDRAPVDESWPTGGVPTSPYSRHKAAAERILDAHEADAGRSTRVTRLRPGIVGQRSAGSALLRYGVPALVPSRLLGAAPVLPMDASLRLPVVHADDVADAVARVLEQKALGAFNLAAEPPVTAQTLADALGARLLPVPSPVLRAAMSAAWHVRLQPVDPGWLDLAFSVPLLDTTRARRELGWAPTADADAVVAEVLDGMRTAAAGDTAVLRPRSVPQALLDAVRRGTVGVRSRP